jgi:diguanylate cyclase (GGDEF)-like protein
MNKKQSSSSAVHTDGTQVFSDLGDPVRRLFGMLRCDREYDPDLYRPITTWLSDESLYSSFLQVICGIRMDEHQAEYHYNQAVKHLQEMEARVGKTLGLRVALLDYLLNITGTLRCPKILEFEEYESLLSLVSMDSLTGLFNRRQFDQSAESELRRSLRYGYPCSVLFTDIDDFKKINDSYGHPAGDRVLRDFAAILKKRLRSEDMAARYGGEEFVVLLPQTDAQGAMTFGENLLSEIRNSLSCEDTCVTFSAGIATFPVHGLNVSEIVSFADQGLYRAKMEGKNRVVLCEENQHRQSVRVPADIDLSISTTDAVTNEKEYHGRIKDVSLNGIAVEADESEAEFEPGQLITCKIATDSGSRYVVQAQIVWVNKDPSRQRYNLGAKYHALNHRDLYELVTQITNYESDPSHQSHCAV